MSQRTLMMVGAHPDDESIIGGTLARYAAQGVRVIVVAATRGEAGTIFDPSVATPDTIAQVREQELRCACEVLGAEPPRILSCADGAVQLCEEAALEPLVRLMRQERPQVVVTFGPDGIYGHPDHVAVSRLTTRAWHLAGDPTAFPAHFAEGLAPFQPARLFYFGLSRSTVEHWKQYADLKVELNGQLLEFAGIPDEQITLSLDNTPYLEQKLRAWACHRSQANPNAPRQRMPEEEQRRFMAIEHFVLAAGVPLDPSRQGYDLFAGLS